MLPQSAWLAISIIGLSFISEDGATVLAAGAAGGPLDLRLAFVSCVLGIWAGDLGLYGAARGLRHKLLAHRFTHRLVTHEKLQAAEQWFERRGVLALVLSRVIPGTRLPTYVAAGTLQMPFALFASVTAACAAVWVGAALLIARTLPGLSLGLQSGTRDLTKSVMVVLAGVLIVTVVRSIFFRAFRMLLVLGRKYRQWEFWPAWLFYAPVVALNAWLAIRYRGLSLPTIANPAQRNGGLIGESKIEILTELMKAVPEFVAEAYLIPPGDGVERVKRLKTLLALHNIQVPFVLKPDVAQRGAGFRKIWRVADAEQYLAQVKPAVILQSYAAGPHEAGIFYYRLPNQKRGEIFAITEKFFPTVSGDGTHTLRELIAQDSRASLLAGTYLRRFAAIADRVLPAGESLRLVEAGNHCQGCIFKNGMHLYSEALRATIHRMSQALPEFFVGRYDVRYSSADELRQGRGFQIVELNGSASEATSIYDSRNSLWSAYRTLYRQWDLVHRIGQMNRDRGHRAPSIGSVIADCFQYQRLSACYPAAD